MVRHFLSVFTVVILSNADAQTINCFHDFNFYRNEGVGVLKNCTPEYASTFYLKCFSKNNHINKLVAKHYGLAGVQEDHLDIKYINGSYVYIFPKTKMPLEGNFIRTSITNRIDTLLSKKDTLYFKKTYPDNIQLSKYFRLDKDTICVVSFYYNKLDKIRRSKLSLINFVNWRTGSRYTDYAIVKIFLNESTIRFVSKTSSSETGQQLTLDYLNGIIRKQKVPASLFWLCIIFRFLI